MKITEADRRKLLISKARKEFMGSLQGKNISEALRLYIEAHPEECAGIPAVITSRERDRPRTILDEFERPECRKCGAPLFWKSGCLACNGPVKKNQWICKECGFKRITKDTLTEAIAKLKLKREI
jgi:hypothetical protein